MQKSLFGCEFGESAGNPNIRIWMLARPDLDITHVLNLPDYNKPSKLHMEGFDGHSKQDMRKAAERYGFTKIDFSKAIKQKKNDQVHSKD